MAVPLISLAIASVLECHRALILLRDYHAYSRVLAEWHQPTM